ncbi:isochorismatase family protein [Paenibacillus pasadenensis]
MFTVDPTTTGIVLTDPQNEFLSPGHPGYELLKPVILQNNTVGNLVKLLQSAKQKGYKVFVSPHYLYPHDHKWQFKGAEETLLLSTYAYDRPDARSPVPPASGAAFVPDLLPFLEDGQTIIANAHKIASPATNDLCLQLRKQGVSKIVLAGVRIQCVRRIPYEASDRGGIRGRDRSGCDGGSCGRVQCRSRQFQRVRLGCLDDRAGSRQSIEPCRKANERPPVHGPGVFLCCRAIARKTKLWYHQKTSRFNFLLKSTVIASYL